MHNYSPSRLMFSVNPSSVKNMKSRGLFVYLLAAGFYSIFGQVVLLRELNVAFYGIELIYIISFAFWLIGTAAGAASGRRSFVPADSTLYIYFLFSAIVLIADIVFIRSVRIIFGGVPGGYLPFTSQIAGLLIALLPAGFLGGLLFRWSANKFIASGETLAKAYAIESAGGIFGAFVSTALLNFGINNFTGGIICGIVLIFIAALYSFRSSYNIIKITSIITLAVFLTALAFSHQIDLQMTSWNHSFLIESRDTPYSRVTITSPENQLCVFEDDILSYETQSISAEEFVQMASLQQIKPERVLVIGGGFAGTISELLQLPVNKIDYVEINRELIDVVQKYLPAGLNKDLTDKKVNIIYNDPRKFLQGQHKYDLIIAGMPEPMSAQTNRFYTEEFFEQCAGSLNKGGIFSFKIQSSENIWTGQLLRRNSGIYNAVKSAFRNIIVLPGVENIFIASNSDLTTDTNVLINRFIKRNLETRLVSPQYIHYIYTNDRFNEIQNLISDNRYMVNSDFHPVCYSYTITIWLSKFFPGLANSGDLLPQSWKSISLYILIVLPIVIFFIIRKSSAAKRIVLVFTAGFIGMVLEIILMLLYQNKNGILYRDIGLLIMAFMAGLTLGSLLINKYFMSPEHKDSHNWQGAMLFIGFLLLSVCFFITIDIISSLLIISLSLLIDGMLVAGIFAFASLKDISDQRAALKQLYTADLIGGCSGSLIASLFLIPIYGFPITLIILIIISGIIALSLSLSFH